MNNNQQQNPEYCVITEQGDLGLGADVLCPKDQQAVQEQYSK